ncbi:MAG TPA: hypothetical protein VFM18_14005, partial [Methanosarcina sp.]|nr:hypothetical protein [Methanosarcina sp.]
NINVQVQERSRSVQMALWTFRHSFSDPKFYDYANQTYKQRVKYYQWRIGGKYFPAQPVKCIGYAPEAHVELKKALQTLGDYEATNNVGPIAYTNDVFQPGGANALQVTSRWVAGTDLRSSTGGGSDLNGLNAEEQSDMNLQLNGVNDSVPSDKETLLTVFVMYDAMLIVKQNNQIELIS